MKKAWRKVIGGSLTGWKRRLYQLVLLVVILGAGGFGVAASGIVPVAASSGHLPITAWFLNFSMARSVSTHSMGIPVPELDDPNLVLRGGGHYAIGCAPCHGNPEIHHPRVAAGLTPHPPYLAPKIQDWEPNELFYIAKHGVKFTGMPAWPTQQRDDEVWAMVAFLLKFPELDVPGYQELVGDAVHQTEPTSAENLEPSDAAPSLVTTNCSRCHLADGMGRGSGAFPILSGQNEEYLAATMSAFATRSRHSGTMETVSAGLNEEEIRELAAYYSRQIPTSRRVSQIGNEEDVDASRKRGAEIAENGIPSARVPACVDCHGTEEPPVNASYPKLNGQYANYLVLQLELFATDRRGGTEYGHLMQPIAARLTAEQMRDVATYYQSLQLTPTQAAESE